MLDDPTVSRFHCEVRVTERGVRLRDLESKNGTFVDGTQVIECYLRAGTTIRAGRTSMRFELGTDRGWVPMSEHTRFGNLTGRSLSMRATFALLERVAAADISVLLHGETGTGKQVAAESLHERSARSSGPFITVDCGNLSSTLLESELFGHEKGAFTGAIDRRIGAFEEASGGTLFLDEIGELPLDLQPKLLRALEAGEVRRLGANHHEAVDLRVVAATHRDLRAEVNAGRFREDLYFRLAVVRIDLPPLRHRPDDLPELVRELLGHMRAPPELTTRLLQPDAIARLQRAAWPGNVRELRNYLHRCLVFDGPPPLETGPAATDAPLDVSMPWPDARARAIASFERSYLEQLLAAHDGVVARAARAAGLDRVYLHKLLRRHNLRA